MFVKLLIILSFIIFFFVFVNVYISLELTHITVLISKLSEELGSSIVSVENPSSFDIDFAWKTHFDFIDSFIVGFVRFIHHKTIVFSSSIEGWIFSDFFWIIADCHVLFIQSHVVPVFLGIKASICLLVLGEENDRMGNEFFIRSFFQRIEFDTTVGKTPVVVDGF